MAETQSIVVQYCLFSVEVRFDQGRKVHFNHKKRDVVRCVLFKCFLFFSSSFFRLHTDGWKFFGESGSVWLLLVVMVGITYWLTLIKSSCYLTCVTCCGMVLSILLCFYVFFYSLTAIQYMLATLFSTGFLTPKCVQ